MKDLELNETEYIILKKEYADDGKHDGEFYITNENLIFSYEEGFFNTRTISYKKPLTSIKKGKDEYQIFYNEESENVEIYYVDGQSEFCFNSKKDTEEVINTIKKTLEQSALNENIYCTSCGAKIQSNAKFCHVCGNKININVEKDDFLCGNNNSIQISKCKGCGAILKGKNGDMVKCEYCDMMQKIL